MRRHDTALPHDRSGFTLIELMVVIAIGALLIQLVVGNLGALIPAKAMDSEARQIVSRIDFMRSEARLQGKTYKIELDLSNHAHRVILPPEDQLVSYEQEKEALGLEWNILGDDVLFCGYEIAGGSRLVNDKVEIVFDANGFTADQTIYLRHKSDESFLWSIQIRGLMATSTIVRDFQGSYHPLKQVDEAAF